MSDTQTATDTECCPECNGEGYTIDVQPRCCGNLTKGGECRGDCAEPEQVQVCCSLCGGNGGLFV
jgi:hypothetical protein